MNNKRQELAERIQRRIYGGDLTKDKQVHIVEIGLALDAAASYVISRNILDNIKVGNKNVNGQYIISFRNIEVKKDSETDQSYIDLPAKYISLPNDGGILSVVDMKNITNPYIPVRFGSASANLTCGNLEGRIGYYPEADKLFFTKDIYEKKIKKLMVKLISSSVNDITDDQKYNLPIELEFEVVEMVVKHFMLKPNDEINDGIQMNK